MKLFLAALLISSVALTEPPDEATNRDEPEQQQLNRQDSTNAAQSADEDNVSKKVTKNKNQNKGKKKVTRPVSKTNILYGYLMWREWDENIEGQVLYFKDINAPALLKYSFYEVIADDITLEKFEKAGLIDKFIGPVKLTNAKVTRPFGNQLFGTIDITGLEPDTGDSETVKNDHEGKSKTGAFTCELTKTVNKYIAHYCSLGNWTAFAGSKETPLSASGPTALVAAKKVCGECNPRDNRVGDGEPKLGKDYSAVICTGLSCISEEGVPYHFNSNERKLLLRSCH